MVEIQCTSCQTRYRIDEAVLPDETPTFKCSRCGHVFTAEPRSAEDAAAPPPKPRARVRRLPTRIAARAAPLNEPEAPPDDNAEAKAAPPPVVPETDPKEAPLNRLIRSPHDQHDQDDAPDKAGLDENLHFDFTDEDAHHDDNPELSHEDDDREGWEVGENVLKFASEPGPPDADSASAEPAGIAAAMLRGKRHDLDIVAMDRGRAVHSAGFFMALFLSMALGFGALSLAICGQPAASASVLARIPGLGERFAGPASGAVLVALRDVKTDYQKINGEHTALVITGNAENVGSQPLHTVAIAVSLLDNAQHDLGRQVVYCGNNLSNKMIGEMTPRELEFFQRLGPPKSFTLAPSALSAFVVVFVDPPSQVGRLAVSIAQTEPAASPSPGA